MQELIEPLTGFFGVPLWSAGWAVAIAVAVFIACRILLTGERKTADKGRQAVGERLLWIDRGLQLYRVSLRRLLLRTDRWIGDNLLARRGKQQSGSIGEVFLGQATPWTRQSYDRCLLLSVVYPVVGLLLAWAFTGVDPTSTGEAMSFESDEGWRRAVFAIGFVFAAIFMRLAAKSSGFRSVAFFAVAAAVAVAVAFAGAFVGTVGGVAAIAFAFAVAFAFAFAGAVAGAVSCGLGLTSCLTFVGAGAGDSAGAVTGAVIGAGAVAVAVAVAWTFNRKRQSGKFVNATFYVAHWVLLVAVVSLTVYFSGPGGGAGGLLILFLTLLPLANAPLDWLSLGITRGLLREALLRQGWRGPVFSLVDLVAAVLLMAPLIVLSVTTISLANGAMVAGGGQPFANLPSVLARIRIDPGHNGNLWIYFMIFSTLLPTVVHTLIGATGIVAGLMEGAVAAYRKGHEIAGQDGGHQDTYNRFLAPLCVSACLTALFVLTVFAGAH